MGEVIAPGWLAGGCPPGAASPAPGGRAAGSAAGMAGAGAATGTVTVAVTVRATRMRRSPFSTSISVRSVSAMSVASSRTSSGSKGLALGMRRSLAIEGQDWTRRRSGGAFGGAANDGCPGVLSQKLGREKEIGPNHLIDFIEPRVRGLKRSVENVESGRAHGG